MPINELYAKSTLITYRNTDDKYDLKSDETATGFFYEHEDDSYLVTNEHAVLDDVKKPIDTFDIHISPSRQISETHRQSVSLLENGSKTWFGHTEADIAVIPLDINFDKVGNHPYRKHDILPRNAPTDGRMVSGGDFAIAIGFPLGFTGKNKLPVIRNALVSTPYGVAFNDEPCFLTDAQMHPGMSGSPVLTEAKLTSVNFREGALDPDSEPEIKNRVTPSNRRYLLGVHSERVSPISNADNESLEQLHARVENFTESESRDTMVNRLKRSIGKILLQGEYQKKDNLQEISDRVSNLEDLLESKIDLNKVWYADTIHHILSD